MCRQTSVSSYTYVRARAHTHTPLTFIIWLLSASTISCYFTSPSKIYMEIVWFFLVVEEMEALPVALRPYCLKFECGIQTWFSVFSFGVPSALSSVSICSTWFLPPLPPHCRCDSFLSPSLWWGNRDRKKKDMRTISRWVLGCSEELRLRPLDKKVHKSRSTYCVSGAGIWHCWMLVHVIKQGSDCLSGCN